MDEYKVNPPPTPPPPRPPRPPPPPCPLPSPPPLPPPPTPRNFSVSLKHTEKRCPLSHPSHPHTLSRKSDKGNKIDCFSCGRTTSFKYSYHFFCKTCDVKIHEDCQKIPRKLTHPYHLQHPLTLTFQDKTGIQSYNTDNPLWLTLLSYSEISESSRSGPRYIEYDRCTWCGENIQGSWFYCCSICNFSLDLSCSQIVPLLLITNPKSHHHPLVFNPRPLWTPCDACGLVNVVDPSYACFQCNYMVHQSCMDLPRVIKITRHQHRLLHTPYLHSKIPICRICYKLVDIKYGEYSCNHEDCSYIVHSKCATHENIWDGKELEWETEESDEIEDILPFKKVGGDLIKHFSHEHLLKLKKYDGVRDAEKQCQACILPINSHDFYNCIQCGFFLHEVCASLVRKMSHALHKHPLFLDSSPRDNYISISCLACSRKSTGFRYICSDSDCTSRDKKFQIDVRCILVPDFFTHESHEHPLFIYTSSNREKWIFCEGCKKSRCWSSYLQCTTCKFALCYQCATVQTEVCYKFDKHPLSLCYGEQPDDIYWCEICEKEVNPADWFYTCNKCCITIHLQCMFGSSVYMKPGVIIKYASTKLEVHRNSNNTRPLCSKCGHRCPSHIYYKRNKFDVQVICSLNCLEK